MAQLIRAEGTLQEVHPANGSHFNLTEMQTLVGGYIEIAQTTSGQLMVLDEEGKLKGKPVNPLATVLYKYRAHDNIAGDVIVGTHLEINGPPEEEEDNPPDDEFSGDRDEEVGQQATRPPIDGSVAVHELSAFMYATPVRGDIFRLYIFDVEGFHGGGQWFRRVPLHPDEELTLEAAQILAERAIADGREVRVTDGGDMLVYHAKDGKRLYPAGTANVWEAM